MRPCVRPHPSRRLKVRADKAGKGRAAGLFYPTGGNVDKLTRDYEEAARRADVTREKVKALTRDGAPVPSDLLAELARQEDAVMAKLLELQRARFEAGRAH